MMISLSGIFSGFQIFFLDFFPDFHQIVRFLHRIDGILLTNNMMISLSGNLSSFRILPRFFQISPDFHQIFRFLHIYPFSQFTLLTEQDLSLVILYMYEQNVFSFKTFLLPYCSFPCPVLFGTAVKLLLAMKVAIKVQWLCFDMLCPYTKNKKRK